MTTASKTRSRRANPKAQLYANLARHGITRVVIEYDGSCDGGCIGDVTLFDADDKIMPMPETRVEFTIGSREYNPKASRFEPQRKLRTGPLREAIENWCYDLLELHFPGWENNDGADGIIELNVPMNTGTWEHNRRYTETATTVREV